MAKRLGDDDSKIDKAAATVVAQTNMTKEAFLDAVTRTVRMNERCAKVNDERRALRKTLKAEGIELGALDAAIKMAEWERGEQRAHFDLRRRYAEWLGLAVGTQPDLFKDMTDDEALSAEWHSTGVTAALTGKASRPPDNCEPRFHADFMRGFAETADADFDQAAPGKPSAASEVAAAKAAVAKKEKAAAAAPKRPARARPTA